MKKLTLMISISVALTILVSCGKQNEVVKDTTQILVNAFNNSDMKTINKLIFRKDEFEIDEELSDIWEDTDESQEGILEYIFAHVTIKVKNISKNIVEYEIEAPDMINVFEDLKTDSNSITEDELSKHIKDYIKSTGTKTTIVSLEYILVDKKPIMNYQDEAFINAITGGLLDAYKQLYSNLMTEYKEGVN